jgi:hypothetical protein
MSSAFGSLQNQYDVSVAVDGVGQLGTFDTLSGGEIDSDEQKYRPGGMQPSISLGGAAEMGNVTVSRNYELDRDHAIVKQLYAAAGRAAMTVSKQPLDSDGNIFGAPLVYQGKLKRVQAPEHDSNSSDPAMLELEMAPGAALG